MEMQNGPLGGEQRTQSAGISSDGQWYVAAFSSALKPGKTLVKTIADQTIVFWRTRAENQQSNDEQARSVQAASAVCPHWGGPLGEGKVGAAGELTCPWHGWQFHNGICRNRPRLKLPRYLAHDDGLLLWVRLPWDVDEVTLPPLQDRPSSSRAFWFHIAIESDVYHVQENYLDFLHPAEYHSTVFSHCVHLGRAHLEGAHLASGDEINLVELGYKLPFGKTLLTRTQVWAPTPYQVRNEVYDGLGTGTVIESHLTPLTADRTLIHELYHVPAQLVPAQGWPLMRYFMQRSAIRIRQEDALFAARRYRLRKLGFVDGRGLPINGQVTPYLDEWEASTGAELAEQKLENLVGKRAPSHY